MSQQEAGPAFTPSTIVVTPMIATLQQNGKRSRSPSVVDSTASSPKGKEVERDPVRRIALPQTPSPDYSAEASTPRSFSPRPLVRSARSTVHLDKPQTRPNVTGMLDSSDVDRVSTALLPAGKPLPPPPPPPAPVADPQPQAKKPRLGPPPLPSGPPTIRTLHILLGPEHVEENQPKRFFDYVRQRELKQPLVKLSPPELAEILGKMRKVNEIWLRTMAEDDGNLQCLASWLKLFINNPKGFEGSIVNLLWVILRAKPSLDKIKAARLGTLAKQALERAKQNNLSRTPEIEKLVSHLDQLIDRARNARSAANGEASGSAKVMPSFKKNASGTAAATAGSSASTSAVRPPAIPRPPEMSALQKILADATAATMAREKAAREAASAPPNGRTPPNNAVAGPGPSASSFRPTSGPTPMVAGHRTSSSNGISRPSSSSGETSYPSRYNRSSSIATQEARNRPYDGEKHRNYKNCTVSYPPAALAEAREFEMDEVEADEPDWWIYKSDPHGHTSHELDQEEGHTMRHLAAGEQTIPWHEPLPYDTMGHDIPIIDTPENQAQDARERGELNVRYDFPQQIPATPDESRARNVTWGPGTLFVPALPRAYIAPPQPRPPVNLYGRAPPAPFSFGAPTPQPTGSSAFRPRNAGAAAPAPPPGGSAYRPRGSSAPPSTQVKTEEQKPDAAALARRNSTSGPVEPKPKQLLPPSNNPDPLPDRAGINSVWRRTAKPRKSALLNPLSATEVAANVRHMYTAEPYDFSRFKMDEDVDGGAGGMGHPPGVPKGSASKQ